MSSKSVDMPSSVFRNSILPRLVTTIKAENHWIHNTIRSQVGNEIYSGSRIAHYLLDQVADRLMADPLSIVTKKETLQRFQRLLDVPTDAQETHVTLEELQNSRVIIPLVKSGIIEIVDLLLHILIKDYREVHRVLATVKATKYQEKKMGRLEDPDYECLSAGYIFVATSFFQTLDIGANCSVGQKAYYSRLYQLFQQEFHLTKKIVEEAFKTPPIVLPAKE
jgi:hypothetical protein